MLRKLPPRSPRWPPPPRWPALAELDVRVDLPSWSSHAPGLPGGGPRDHGRRTHDHAGHQRAVAAVTVAVDKLVAKRAGDTGAAARAPPRPRTRRPGRGGVVRARSAACRSPESRSQRGERVGDAVMQLLDTARPVDRPRRALLVPSSTSSRCPHWPLVMVVGIRWSASRTSARSLVTVKSGVRGDGGGVVFIGILEGVALGIAVAVAVAMHRLARTGSPAEERDGRQVIFIRGQLTFLAVPRLRPGLLVPAGGADAVVELDGSFMDHAAYGRDWQASHRAQWHGGDDRARGDRIAEPAAGRVVHRRARHRADHRNQPPEAPSSARARGGRSCCRPGRLAQPPVRRAAASRRDRGGGNGWPAASVRFRRNSSAGQGRLARLAPGRPAPLAALPDLPTPAWSRA